ncbi:MAG: hypothetical protein ACKOWF_04165 [Chloroflexota bacterium]
MTPLSLAVIMAKTPFLSHRSESDTVNAAMFLVGLAIVGWSSVNAIRTFMLPGAANPGIGRIVFACVQRFFLALGRVAPGDGARTALYSVFGPVSLLAVYITLILINGIGFACMFWSLGQRTIEEALIASGSSLSTLGFASFSQLSDTALSVVEAMSTTTISALLIGYLPTIFSSYLSCEKSVRELEARIENPDCGPHILATFSARNAPEAMSAFWDDWTSFFTQMNVSHGTMVGTLFLRSPQSGRTWVQGSGSVLDAAALSESVLDQPSDPAARRCLAAGATTLRQFVGHAGFERQPLTGDPELDSGVTRAEFETACDQLAAEKFAVKADREAAWQEFVAIRATYGAALMALARIKYSPCMSIACAAPAKHEHLHLPFRRRKHLPHAGA